MIRAIASTLTRTVGGAIAAYTRCPHCEANERHLAELGSAYNKAEADKGAMMRTASAQGATMVELRVELEQQRNLRESFERKWYEAQTELNRILRQNPNLAS